MVSSWIVKKTKPIISIWKEWAISEFLIAYYQCLWYSHYCSPNLQYFSSLWLMIVTLKDQVIKYKETKVYFRWILVILIVRRPCLKPFFLSQEFYWNSADFSPTLNKAGNNNLNLFALLFLPFVWRLIRWYSPIF